MVRPCMDGACTHTHKMRLPILAVILVVGYTNALWRDCGEVCTNILLLMRSNAPLATLTAFADANAQYWYVRFTDERHGPFYKHFVEP